MTVQTQATLNALAHMAASTGAAHSHPISSSTPAHSHGLGLGTGGGFYGGTTNYGYGIGNYGNLIISPSTGQIATPNIGGYTVHNGVPLAVNMRFDSSNPLQLYVFNRAVPEGETFTKSKDLFGTDFRLDEHQFMVHHFLMWATEYGEEFTDYGTVMRSNDGCFIAFGSKETRDHFTEWFERYKTVFFKGHDITGQYPMVEPGALNGFYIKESRKEKDANISYLALNEWTERDWSWITTHCAHQVLRFQNGWFFTHESDAVLFKMKPDY